MLELADGLQDAGHGVGFELPADAVDLRADVAARGMAVVKGDVPRGVWHLHLANTYDVLAVRRLLAVRRQAGRAIVTTEHLARSNASDTLVDEARTPGATLGKTVFKR